MIILNNFTALKIILLLSLGSIIRANSAKDKELTIRKKIQIGNNVFIGAYTTILKGVTIGDNFIVGACSIVARDIPENEIWAGNPVKLIRKINDN